MGMQLVFVLASLGVEVLSARRHEHRRWTEPFDRHSRAP
jgi:hypothetical protein